MSQYQDQERIAQEARSDAELRQSHFENRLKDVDDDIVQNAKKYVPEMLKWEKELGLEIGTVETLINVYGEDAYQIMYQAQNDPDYFQNMMPTRLRSTVNTLNQKASIIRVFRDNSLNNAEKINCFSNGPKYKFDRNTAQGIINNTRNEQKLQYGLTNKASLDELKAVQAYTRAFQYCKDHGYKYITDNNLIYEEVFPNVTSPDRPRLTRSQLKLAKDALQTIGQNKYQELFDTPNEPILKNIAIEELLAAGVTLEDFQTLANQMHADVLKDQELNKRDHPELCHVMIPGATMEILAEAGFDKYPGESVRASGNCGFGTKGILTYAKTKTALKKRTAQTAASAGYTKAGFARAQSTGYDPTTGYATSFVNSICSNLDISNLPPGLSLAGGCRYWIGPENAALAINLTYDNAAQGFYPLTKGSAQDKMRMNWLTNHCPQGTMICWDNQVKASGNTFSNAAPGDGHGPQHGHVNLKLTAPAEAVNISSRQIYGCDGVQISASDTSLPKGEAGPNNAGWYGEYLHTTFTLDAQIPQKYAERLLILATIRTGGSLNIEKNRAAFYPKNATERKKVRQQRMQSAKHIKYTGINKNPNNPNNEQQRQPSRATRRIGSFHSQSNQKN